MGGIGDELAVDAADAHRADRAGQRNVGDAERGGGAVDGEDVGVVFAVGAEEQGDDLGVVEVALGEERTQRTVGHAAGEDFLFGRAAFALEVAAGELAGGGGFFAVFDGEREQVLAFLDLGGGDGGDDDDGVAQADGDGAVGQFGELAGFDGDVALREGGGDVVDGHVLVFFLFGLLGNSSGCARRGLRIRAVARAEGLRRSVQTGCGGRGRVNGLRSVRRPGVMPGDGSRADARATKHKRRRSSEPRLPANLATQAEGLGSAFDSAIPRCA